ncbi:ScbR family autoregulator-binding transcription factor [Nocardia sp. NPDC052566]|uniref:ScbR family autoregulator-binding transcription factor n=1 Tax=Nocardia sp. NPDC052566 TaxID=3364330 RepID=UPI0037C911E7
MVQERAVETRNQIVHGAAEVFDTEGFAGASIGMIVAAAGTTRGALHFHFRTKEELAKAVMEEQGLRELAAIQKLDDGKTPAIEQVVMLAHEMVRLTKNDPVVRAGVRLSLELTFVDSPKEPYLGCIMACEEMIRRAIMEGDIIDTVSPPILARFTISAFMGVQLVSTVLTERRDLEQRVDEMWDTILLGIMPGRRRRKADQVRAARWCSAAESPAG